ILETKGLPVKKKYYVKKFLDDDIYGKTTTTSLTRIAQSLLFSTSFLVDIVQAEILSTSSNTFTFRGNSIETKSMEANMKLIGETLTCFVTDVVSSKNFNDINLKVDSDQISNLQNLE
ncbi:unnamed protein product, partial [Rotaria sp. Silwood2]